MAEYCPVSGEEVIPTPSYNNVTDSDALYSQEILQTLNSLRSEGFFCDVTLMVEGKEFKAHRNILASSSSYFRNMFTIEMKERTEAKVAIEALSSSYMEKLLTYIYTGTVEFENESCARELLVAADYLVIPRLSQAAGDFLLRNLTTSNCLGVNQAAVMISNERLKCGTFNFINKKFMAVAKTEGFLNLDVDEVIDWICSDEVEVTSEEDMFEVIVSWVEHSKEKRKECLLRLLGHVRLTLLPPNYLHARVLNYELIRENRDCLNFVLNRVGLGVKASQLDTSLCERPRKCLDTHRSCLMVFMAEKIREAGVFSYKYSQRLFVPDEDKVYTFLQNTVSEKNFVAIISCQGFVYKLYGASIQVERYDPSINSWANVAPIPKVVQLAGLTSLNGVLYVCGGRPSHNSEPSSDVLTYNPKTNTWQERAQMIHPRYALCAVAAGQHIYAIGGKGTHDTTNTVQQFDPKSGKWNIVSSMTEKRYAPCGASYNNTIFVFGGFKISSAEMYDVVIDQWQMIESMTSPRCFASAVVIQDVVYVVGGYFNSSPPEEIVECYNPSTEQWMGKCSFTYEKPNQSTTLWYSSCCPVKVPKILFALPEVRSQST